VTSIVRAEEIAEYATAHGDAATLKHYRLNVGSLARYKAMARGKAWQPSEALRCIAERYTPVELRALARGADLGRPSVNVPPVDFDGKALRFGFITDTHFGSRYSLPEHYEAAIDECKRQDCAFIAHTGDLTEGMSQRPGHVFECDQIGYTAQRDHAEERLRLWPGDWYLIDGNHDRWFVKAADARIVKDVAEAVPRAKFLGHDMGTLPLKGGASLMLWHGEDANSYATSYRLQKIVESLAGGTKPNVLLAGHTHKQGYFFERNIHVVSGGCIQVQTPWMRGKRIAAHPGFHIIDLWLNGPSVSRLTLTWYPFYA